MKRTTLYCYRYNPQSGKLESGQAVKVDPDGYVTVKQSRCSAYVLTRPSDSSKGGLPRTDGLMFSLLLWLLPAIFIGVSIALAINRKIAGK